MDGFKLLRARAIKSGIRGAGAFGGSASELPGRDLLFGDALGGGVFNRGDLQIVNSTLGSNQALGGSAARGGDPQPYTPIAGMGAGGGIASQGPLGVTNSTLTANLAKGGDPPNQPGSPGPAYGGATYISGGTASFLNVTIAGNLAEAALGAQALGASLLIAGGSVALTNTILLCAPGQSNVSGVLSDGGHNISSDASAMFSTSSSQSNLDPLLGPLLDNGGRTPTMAPVEPGHDAPGMARIFDFPGSEKGRG